jgi:hypothetical protein
MGLDIAGLGAVSDLVKTVVNKFFPDKTEEQKAEIAQAMVLLQGQIDNQKAQVDVNKVEAASSSVFVAGWRPAIGWVCVLALFFQYIARPLLMIGFAVAGKPFATPLPGLDDNLWQLLLGMLGLGTLRTFEKVKGVAS